MRSFLLLTCVLQMYSVIAQDKQLQRLNEWSHIQKSSKPEVTSFDAGSYFLGALAIAALSYSILNDDKTSRKPEGRYVGERGYPMLFGNPLGEKQGQGTFYYSNGDKYVGNWRRDNQYGQGTYHFQNGDIMEGLWLYNKIRKGNYWVRSKNLLISAYFDYKRNLCVGHLVKLTASEEMKEAFSGFFDIDSFLPEGYGYIYLVDKTVVASGLWINGQLHKNLPVEKVKKKLKKSQDKHGRSLNKIFRK